MDNLIISSGIKHISIENENGQVTGEISFNPSDVLFAEKFYVVYGEFQSKLTEYLSKAQNLDLQKDEFDANGMPINAKQGIEFLREVCDFMRGKIDELFGSGASQSIFGDVLNLNTISQFFEGITPYFQTDREKKISKYQRNDTSRVRE